ncbi:MAG: hypothetical protein PVF95_07855 [bacterium]|jgi:hypothetical protein
MKEACRRAVVGIGTIVSLGLSVLIGSFWVARAHDVTHPFRGSMIIAVLLFAGPLALVFLIFSSITSFRIQGPAWCNATLAGVNIIGAIIAALLSLFLLTLGRISLFNPG